MTSNSHDAALRELLRSHDQTKPVRNPDFRSAVWARIEERRSAPANWGAWVRLHFAGFAMAAVASVVLAAGLGGWAGKSHEAEVREAMLKRYVASIDPHHQADSSAANFTR